MGSSDRIFAAPAAGENGSMPFAKQTDLREVSISSSWMLPLAPATNRPAINPYETAAGNTSSHGAAPSSGWLRTLASPPQSRFAQQRFRNGVWAQQRRVDVAVPCVVLDRG